MQIDLIMDLQYGSTGKGLLAGYLAETSKPDGVATCNMPNAGHTYIDKVGNVMIHKVLPNGIVSPNLTSVFIGPGAVFDPARLEFEVLEAKKMGYLETACVYIHPNAMVLREDHRDLEQQSLSNISSTMQGSMAATVEKMVRDPDKRCLASDVYTPQMDRVYVVDHDQWMHRIDACEKILAEGSQGFSLGLNQRFWPYCTSRECTPYRLLSDMGLPQIRATVWGTLRTYPIRVGNTPDGFSGPVYYDQAELTWEDLDQPAETTTVTGRIRRVFSFSREQLDEALWHCRPDHLFLNFANYMNEADLGRLVDDINAFGADYGTGIRLVGYGPAFGDVRPFHTG
jgi:adenylosuccinate synthase